MSDTKAAAATDEQAEKPVTEATTEVGKDESLEDIFGEFRNRGVKSDPASQKPKPKLDPERFNQAVDYLIEQQQVAARKAVESDLAKAVDEIHADADLADLPKSLIDSRINALLMKDFRILSAFRDRHTSDQWSRVVKSIQKDLKKDLEGVRINRTATDDREAARAAARTTSTRTRKEGYDPMKVANASPAELAEMERQTIADSRKARGR